MPDSGARTRPAIEAFVAAHRFPDVTVVADAGMVSEARSTGVVRRSNIPQKNGQ